MKLTLNIGLSRPAGGKNTIAETLAALPKGYGIEWKHRLAIGDCKEGKENCLVITGEIEQEVTSGFLGLLAVTAEKLGQDCIAVANDCSGTLVGPKPYAEGFKPEFFIAY